MAVVRDNYDSKKIDFESQITTLLGFPVTLNIDPGAILAYAKIDSGSAGALISGWVILMLDLQRYFMIS